MNKLLLACLLCVSLSVALAGQTGDRKPGDAALDRITLVKGTQASNLDARLPATRLEDWLLEQVGVNAKFGWVLRYKPWREGEPKHDFPDSVEADVGLQDGRSIDLLVAFHDPGQRPYVYSLYVIAGKHETIKLRRLSDLTDFLRQSS
jgi:hypothetical protein